MLIRLLAPFAIGFACIAAAPAPAQEPAPPVAPAATADLRSRLDPGDEHAFSMTIDTVMNLRAPAGAGGGHAGGPEEQKQTTKQRVDFVVGVQARDDQGLTLTLTYTRLSYSLDSANLSGSFDSEAPDDGGELARALRPVVGTRLRVTVNAKGKVTAVSGGEALAAAADPAAGSLWPRIAAQFGERAIVASFVEPILTTHHPSGTARPGEKWSYRDTLEQTTLGTFTIMTDSVLDSVAGDSASITLSGSIVAESPGGEERPRFELLGSENGGRAVWNTSQGVLDSLDQTQGIRLRAPIQGTEMELDNTTRVVLTRVK